MLKTWRWVFLLACAALAGCSDFWVEPQMSQITVTPATPSMVVGYTQQFTAVATYDDGSRKVVSQPTWSSSNVTVVFVNASGMATAVSAGTATVTATSGVASGSTNVTIVSSPMTSLQIAPNNPSISLSSHQNEQFQATATFADGTTQDITNTVTWSSSNTSAATISATGLATPLAIGSTVIKAVSGSTSATTNFTILP